MKIIRHQPAFLLSTPSVLGDHFNGRMLSRDIDEHLREYQVVMNASSPSSSDNE